MRRTVALVCLLAACRETRPPATAFDTSGLSARVDSLATAVFEAELRENPETGTELGLPSAEHGRLRDNSPTATRIAQSREDALYQIALTIDPSPLAGQPQWVTYGVLRDRLERSRALRVCRYPLWGVASYVNGWQAVYTDLAMIQPVGTDTLRAQALMRARALPRFIDTEVANLRAGLEDDYSSPKVIVQNVIRQLDNILATPVRQSPFYSPAARDSSAKFGAELARIISEELTPAIERYRDFLAREYLRRARNELGVSENPDGLACYRASVRSFATVEIDPDSVFAMGLAQMARIEAEMNVISTRSFGGEAVPALLLRLRTDPRFTFGSSQEIIDTAQAVIVRAKAAMGQWFGRLPQADVVIQPYPEFRQKAGAPGQYQSAPEDGSRPAIFLINPSRPTEQSRAGVQNLSMHEAIPGHHLQVAIAKERKDLHVLSRYTFSSGFGEGWALYAERVGDEMGLYSSDLGRMGMLTSEAFRAARMVIDAGIHTKGWTREQALEYLTSHTTVATVITEGEIDRYISWPGQAPSYMIGRTEIMRLRENAKATLGDRFDIRAFHDRVLEDGTVPLALLGTKVAAWVESQKQ